MWLRGGLGSGLGAGWWEEREDYWFGEDACLGIERWSGDIEVNTEMVDMESLESGSLCFGDLLMRLYHIRLYLDQKKDELQHWGITYLTSSAQELQPKLN